MNQNEIKEMLRMMGEDREVWKVVEGHPRYEVSTWGRVRNKKRGNILKPRKTGNYFYIHFELNGKNYSLHRLIASVFIPNPENLPYVDHIDRNPANNRVSNLRWCSQTQNIWNTRIRADNTSGKTGVRRNQKSWQASWYINGVSYSKTFPTFEEASAFRDKMVQEHYDPDFYHESKTGN